MHRRFISGTSRGFKAALSAGIMVALLLSITLQMACRSAARADDIQGTFSIAAYDSATGEVGVAVQSRVFGVGPRVAWVAGGAGAIATQALANESFGPDGLRLLAAGLSAQETLTWLLAHDPERDQRQVGIVDARGGVANWTGPACHFWAGDSTGACFTCQGNILTGADVIAAMVKAFFAIEDQELARRLLAALAACGESRFACRFIESRLSCA